MIKKILFTIFLGVTSSIVFCQTITIAELTKYVDCKDYESYESIINKKGFSYTDMAKDDEHAMYTFTADTLTATSVNGTSVKEKSDIFFTPGYTTVSYLTPSKAFYTACINELKLKGYTVVKTEKEGTMISTYYKNKKIAHGTFLLTTMTDTQDGVEYKLYRIAITKTNT